MTEGTHMDLAAIEAVYKKEIMDLRIENRLLHSYVRDLIKAGNRMARECCPHPKEHTVEGKAVLAFGDLVADGWIKRETAKPMRAEDYTINARRRAQVILATDLREAVDLEGGIK